MYLNKFNFRSKFDEINFVSYENKTDWVKKSEKLPSGKESFISTLEIGW